MALTNKRHNAAFTMNDIAVGSHDSHTQCPLWLIEFKCTSLAWKAQFDWNFMMMAIGESHTIFTSHKKLSPDLGGSMWLTHPWTCLIRSVTVICECFHRTLSLPNDVCHWSKEKVWQRAADHQDFWLLGT